MTAIEWTDVTWNPVRGCTKVSSGCKNCYAETFAERFRGVSGHPYEQGFDLRLAPHKLAEPLRWTKPRTVFVNSMSDLFQAGIPGEYITDVLDVMRNASWHTYQVLTKRADRLLDYVRWAYRPRWGLGLPGFRHIWVGVSVEDRKHGLPRIAQLRQVRAAVRFLSIEPLLEDLGPLDLSGINWVIVGGESGPGARPMAAGWVRDIQRQCSEQGVHFFFKQWGGVHKRLTGRLLDGRTWDEMPERIAAALPSHAERMRRVAHAEYCAEQWATHPLTSVRSGR